MTLLQQCQLWHENDEFQKIIDALEALPESERTPETDGELARAYNNQAGPGTPEGRAMLRRAIALLKPHAEELGEDHHWNFRMGYAYFYLDQEGTALCYFEKALKARPGDEDTQEFIESCQEQLAFPRFSENFRERTETAWAAFAEQEAKLRRIMDEDKAHERGDELIAQCDEILCLAFEDISFEMGAGGEKYELILTPEGDEVKLFELVYFRRHAPASVLEHWNVLVGRQPAPNMGLRAGGWEINGGDVQVWVEKLEDGSVGLTAYCEKLLPLLQQEEGRAEWMLYTLTDQVLGEINAMRYIASFDVVKERREEPSIPLDALPQALRDMGLDLAITPEAYLENSYTGYEMKPNEDPEADWRLDVIAGSTNCPALINGYLKNENDFMDALHADGGAAGFLCYPLDSFAGEGRGEKIFAFRDRLEAALAENAGTDALTLTGGATGVFCGYLDFIAWDLNSVLRAAKEFFDGTDIPWAGFHVFRRDAATISLKKPEGHGPDGEGPEEEPEDGDEPDAPDGEDPREESHDGPEVYTEEEMEAVEQHIQRYFGVFENVFHELVSPDIHVDVCIVPPSAERDYYTLVTMGMGAHRMNVPEELAEYKLERAELAIALPADWKVQHEDLKDERWYWPIRLLKELARLPIRSHTWLGWGHTMDGQHPFAEDTQLCASILVGPQTIRKGSAVCVLPGGEEVNFYQVIPLYRDEMEYKMAHDADALLDKMEGLGFVVQPDRPDAMDGGPFVSGDSDVMDMDDAVYHLETIYEKALPVDERSAYSHLAIYLRWCIENDLMSQDFLAQYGGLAAQVQDDPDTAGIDLRDFVRDELGGRLTTALFSPQGQRFARYYYGDATPYFPGDIDDYSLKYFGPARYHSDEFQDEAYLYIPFDENYYRAMAKVVDRRFANWQGQAFDMDTAEPSPLAEALQHYLGCKCEYFPSMKDDDPILSAFGYAQRRGVREGYIPVLVRADETLWECLIMNSDPDSEGAKGYVFSPRKVAKYRKKLLARPVKDGKAVLADLVGDRREEAEDDGMDWQTEVLGAMERGFSNDRFASYWDHETDMTYPLILAKIPVEHPWEVFAYLPFGGWNDCPGTPELMAAAKYWFEQYGAVPAALTHDELEFVVPAPVPRERAMELAVEQYGLCPDQDQGEGNIGALADTLWRSAVWYFWWD